MGEDWVSTRAGRHLAGRKKTNTKPEVELRRALHAAGARFRLHRQIAQGCTPDIVMPAREIAIFVDGCFWHSCPRHGRKRPWTGPNAELWRQKMLRNAERDRRSTEVAEQSGWVVARFWECEIREDLDRVVNELIGRSGDARQASSTP